MIFDESKPVIAPIANEPSYFSGFMVMIDRKVERFSIGFSSFFADSANAFLLFKHFLVLLGGYSIAAAQMLMPIFQFHVFQMLKAVAFLVGFFRFHIISVVAAKIGFKFLFILNPVRLFTISTLRIKPVTIKHLFSEIGLMFGGKAFRAFFHDMKIIMNYSDNQEVYI